MCSFGPVVEGSGLRAGGFAFFLGGVYFGVFRGWVLYRPQYSRAYRSSLALPSSSRVLLRKIASLSPRSGSKALLMALSINWGVPSCECYLGVYIGPLIKKKLPHRGWTRGSGFNRKVPRNTPLRYALNSAQAGHAHASQKVPTNPNKQRALTSTTPP